MRDRSSAGSSGPSRVGQGARVYTYAPLQHGGVVNLDHPATLFPLSLTPLLLLLCRQGERGEPQQKEKRKERRTRCSDGISTTHVLYVRRDDATLEGYARTQSATTVVVGPASHPMLSLAAASVPTTYPTLKYRLAAFFRYC